MIIRVKFTKRNYLKYISHLDLMRLFQRTFRRGDIPIKYSEGFNPQPKLSIANPLALGIASDEEYMDIDLDEKMPAEDFANKMNMELPEDIKVLEAKYIEENKSISSLVSWSFYEIKFEANNIGDEGNLESLIKEWLTKAKIIITKVRRKGKKVTEREQDIKPLIGNVIVKDMTEGWVQCHDFDTVKQYITINCLLKAGDNGNLKPTDFINAMEKYLNIGIDFDTLEIKRLKLFVENNGNIAPPM